MPKTLLKMRLQFKKTEQKPNPTHKKQSKSITSKSVTFWT